MKAFGKILAIVALLVGLWTSAATAGMMRSRTIHQSEYGKYWAFTVPAGILYCMTAKEGEPMIAFVTENAAYALNQAAKDSGYADIDPILKRPAKAIPFLNNRESDSAANVNLFVTQGIRLCSS